MNRPIIDMHTHLMPDETAVPEYEKTAEQLGLKKIVFQGLEWPGVHFSRNAAILRAIDKRPDLFVGFGGINLWDDVDPDIVDKLKDEGFTGLKFIVPPEPYHSERFCPYYQRAEKLGMPVLFHLGIVSANDTKEVYVDNNYMRPIYLDTIARTLPFFITILPFFVDISGLIYYQQNFLKFYPGFTQNSRCSIEKDC